CADAGDRRRQRGGLQRDGHGHRPVPRACAGRIARRPRERTGGPRSCSTQGTPGSLIRRRRRPAMPSMSESERIALAARLHVALRRKHGRVTDTEWMATNAEYAAETVRMTRIHAAETKDDE